MGRNRAMISNDVFCGDAFFDLSVEARLLYPYILLNADNIGAFNSVKSLLRMAGVNQEAFTELVEAGFVIDLKSCYAVCDWWNQNTHDKAKYPADRSNYYDEMAEAFGDIDSYKGRYVLLPTRYQDGTDTVPNALITEHNGTRNLPGTERNQTEQNQKEGTLTKIEHNPKERKGNAFWSANNACPKCLEEGVRDNYLTLIPIDNSISEAVCQIHGSFIVDESGCYYPA